jgi:hypothetical protein
MNFTKLGYRGNFIQLAPATRLVNESHFFMMGTSYGNPSLIESIFDECQREYLAANQDFDVTSPFPKLTCLDGIANRLYTTTLFLNDYIYSSYNKGGYVEGLEFLILQKVNQKIYWVQIGWPHIFLVSQKHILGLDHSLGQRSFKADEAPTLPNSLLGLENSLNFRVESSNLRKNEELLFVKSESLPSSFYKPKQTDNESLIKSIYKHNPKAGAWLGRLSFSDDQKAANNKVQNL